MDGKPWAEVTVYLNNAGPDAFRHDIFGDRICVVRRIAKGGATTYKIKSSKGITKYTKRSDLQNILDHFGIDVSNPLSILTQEMAKRFIARAGSEAIYNVGRA